MNAIEIVLSTRNPSKADQIKAVFAGLSVRILTLADADVSGEALENGTTLEENARKKAVFAWERTRKWSMADDTGLFIEALDGKPGVHAARWAGNVATEEIMRFTLAKLKGIANRTATFRTVAVVVAPDGKHLAFTGEVKGSLLAEPRVPCQPKMPYSAIFVPDGQMKSWAEMSVDEENAISHRGKAFRQVRSFFEKTLQ